MSGALFREELGTPAGNGRVELGDWELAQQLAYALGDRGPGAVPTWRWPETSAPSIGHYGDIANAARDGGIRSPEVVGSLIAQHTGGVDATRFDLVQDFGEEDRPRRGEYWLSDGTANFFRQWLGYTEVVDKVVNPPWRPTPAMRERSVSNPSRPTCFSILFMRWRRVYFT